MGRGSAAAAADDGGPGFHKFHGGGPEFSRAKIENGLVPFQTGEPRVGFRHQRDPGVGLEPCHDPGHGFGPHRTVAAEGVRPQRLKTDQGAHGVAPGEGPARFVEGHGHHDGKIRRKFAHGDQRRPALLKVEHGLDGEAVHAAFQQTSDLDLVDFDAVVEGTLAEGLHQFSRGSHVAEDHRPVSHPLTADAHQMGVEFPALLFQTEFGQFAGIGAEGGRVDDIGPGLDIGILNGVDRRGVFRHPLFRAYPGRHPLAGQLGSGGPVQTQDAFSGQSGEKCAVHGQPFRFSGGGSSRMIRLSTPLMKLPEALPEKSRPISTASLTLTTSGMSSQ